MKPSEVEAHFRTLLAATPSITIATALEFMAYFYRESRIDGCALDLDRDMLLFQFGTTKGRDGQVFEVDLTRQLIPTGADEPSQLHVTCRFPASMGQALGSHDDWCDHPNHLEAWLAGIRATPCYKATADLDPDEVRISFEQC
ncbi:MAG: hypothetical protein JW751_23715 [Polyangiaceae bacterium]|nr:hypothetical protein [Polyangiaceae bacterium]